MLRTFSFRLFLSVLFASLLSAAAGLTLADSVSSGPSRFLYLFIVSSLLSLAATLFLLRRTRRRLRKMTEFSVHLGAVEPGRKLTVVADDELGSLEVALSNAALAVEVKVAALEEERGQREAVLACMGEGVIVVDLEGRVVLSNKMAGDLFGGVQAGRKITEITRNPDLLDLVEKGRNNWGIVSAELALPGQEKLFLSATVSPFIRQMKLTGSVVVFHDITKLKKLETMRKDFVANVSHELKTPLTSIKGYAETLSQGGLDDHKNALGFVETIRRNSERLSRLVDDLLTLSNIELGRVVFDIRVIDLAELCEAVFSTLRQRADEKGLVLDLRLAGGLNVKGDRDRLEQVLMNLVDNAIKFTDRGGVTIEGRRLGEKVEIVVVDTGCGVPPKDIERLGERFYRVDPARSRSLGGTGLGLAIVKHLIGSMSGAVAIESREGEGTRVLITLPAA